MIKHIAVFLITFYQQYLSLVVKILLGTRRICFQYPTCSEYTKQAIQRYGIVSGSIKGGKRILQCRPGARYA